MVVNAVFYYPSVLQYTTTYNVEIAWRGLEVFKINTVLQDTTLQVRVLQDTTFQDTTLQDMVSKMLCCKNSFAIFINVFQETHLRLTNVPVSQKQFAILRLQNLFRADSAIFEM